MIALGLLPVLAIAAVLFQPGGVAHAATIKVTTTADVMVNNTTCSLREAIIAANNNSNLHEDACTAGSATKTDTITLAGGATYSLTISGSGDDEGEAGDLDVLDNTASLDLIIKSGGGPATIEQNAATDDRVLHVIDGAAVQVKKVNFSGGGNVTNGGGILVDSAALTLDTCIVTGNVAAESGGGIAVLSSTLTLLNSTVSSNAADFGGGLNTDTGSTVLVDDSTISNNSAGSLGGGIATADTSLTIQNGSSITANAASLGGGIFQGGSTTLIQTGSTVSLNTSIDNGGGIYQSDGTTSLLTGSAIVDNNSQASGGGAFIDGGTLLIDASTIQSNDAGLDGGGLYIRGNTTLQNGSIIGGDSIVDRNQADNGGGIYNESAFLTVDASTVAENRATVRGGGIYNTGVTNIQNGSQVIDNFASNDGGGLWNNSAITIDDSKIDNNQSAAIGGGIFNNSSGNLTISESSISNNDGANAAGGIRNGGQLVATVTAFVGNTSRGGGDAVFNMVNVVNATQVTGSCIAGNGSTAVTTNQAALQNFTGNWWGAATGPTHASNPGGTGDSVSSNINFSGFLTSEGGTCADNLLLNASFETDTTPADGLPDDWTTKKISLGPDGLDTSEFSDGAQSFRFAGNGDGSKLEQVVIVSGNQGDSYTLTFDALRNGVNGGGSAFVQVQYFYNDGSKKIYQQKLANGTDGGFVGYTINALAEKSYIKLVITVQNSKSAGTIRFDNLVITQD
jgi:CSLREA domain-containing protein